MLQAPSALKTIQFSTEMAFPHEIRGFYSWKVVWYIDEIKGFYWTLKFAFERLQRIIIVMQKEEHGMSFFLHIYVKLLQFGELI